MRRRHALGTVLGSVLAGTGAGSRAAVAQEFRLFRIGTGGPSGTYFAIGGALADALSSPPGSRPCRIEEGGCGIPGLIAIAQSTAGSVANVDGLQKGTFESAFVQSDVAADAFAARGAFAGTPAATRLRLIASLYPETVHLLARADSGIASVRDLKGRRVALDEPGSGTLVDARLVLAAFGLSESDLAPVYVKHAPALALMRKGGIDAMFVVGGDPMAPVAEAIADIGARLVPIDGAPIEALLKRERFLMSATIEPELYPGQAAIPTIAVAAQWLVTDGLSDELGFALTRVLFDPETLARLAERHPQGRRISLATALSAASVPLHRGAERFYRERGVLSADQ